MTEAFTYARISADMEGDAHGVASQIRDCHDFIDENGWTAGRDYIDNDISAYRDVHRPSFEQLLKDMKEGRVPVLVVWHIDRLCRRVQDLSRVIDAARTGGTRINTVKAGDFDLTTASGEMTAYLIGTIAQFEARHSSERQVASQHDRALKGVWRGGKAPFGYRSAGKGKLEIDDYEAKWLHQWRRWLLEGESILAIVRRTRAAAPAGHILADLSNYGLRSRLVNPAVAALIQEHGEIAGPAQWEPIFTRDEYDAVRAILRDPARRTHQGTERRWQGVGVYTCGVCGGRIRTAKTRNKAGGRRYACEQNCVSVDQAAVDEIVKAVVVGYLSKPENRLYRNAAEQPDEKKADDLRATRNELVRRKDDLGVAFAEGEIDREQLSAGTRTLQGKLEALDRSLAEIRRRVPLVDLALEGDDLADRWDYMSADKRATIIRMLIDVKIMPTTRTGPRLPVAERLNIEWK